MNYNTDLWIVRVNFDKDYKHVVDFFSSAKPAENMKRQFEFFKNLASYHYNNYSPVYERDGSGAIQVNGNKDNWSGYNYIIFKNADSEWVWYAFIDSVEYNSEKTTTIYYTIDIWQTYHLRTNLRLDSWIDRAHIRKSADTLGANLEPEPFSVKPTITRDIKSIFETSQWAPQWVLHSASKYINNDFVYTGNGTANTYGEYGFYIDSVSDIENYIEQYGRKSLDKTLSDAGTTSTVFFSMVGLWLADILQGNVPHLNQLSSVSEALKGLNSASDLQDHRNELIGLYAIPLWAKSGTEATNTATNVTEALSLNTNLACGYTPKNNKLLSSVFKCYILYARNGTMLAYKPEAFSAVPSLTCSCIPMGTSKYYAYMSNYNERDKQFIPVAYRSERRVGYDANTGLNKVLAVLGQSERVIGAGATLATGIVAKNPTAILSGAEGLIGSGVGMIDALGNKEGGFGSNGELIDITGGRAQLRWADVSPTYNECVHIDKFLTAYGYAQNTIGDLYSNCLTRSRFNYVKSSNPNLRVNGNENVNMKMKEIFNNGVTIWHDYNYMYDYETANN